MLNITGRNVNEVFASALIHFKNTPLLESKPRGERRLQYPYPVASHYLNPRERILFHSVRDANPFFHFMEALWIIAGRSDVQWLSQWLPSIADYSDDGRYFHGAYGMRLRRDNQLDEVVKRLMTEPDTTRAVLQIYDHMEDKNYRGKDMPCNCMLFLGIQDNKLNLTVSNRSNDMIWGAYGANVVQFSMLQEYIAGLVGVPVGWYIQFSNNAHIYPDKETTRRVLNHNGHLLDNDLYAEGIVAPYPMWQGDGYTDWHRDLDYFIKGSEGPYKTPFFAKVALPMQAAHLLYRERKYNDAIDLCNMIEALDWRVACRHWLMRRLVNAENKGLA